MVSTTIDYDVDTAKLPKIVILIVTISDQQLLTGTATLTIRFADCNDNAPIFPVSFTLLFCFFLIVISVFAHTFQKERG